MRFSPLAAFLGAFVVTFVVTASAPIDARRKPVATAPTELVVYESAACPACTGFREGVIRPYFASGRGARLPMSVIDMDMLGTAGRALKAPVTRYPTAVVMAGGIEVGRIEGPRDAGAFLAAVDGLMRR
ncbi:MAG: hypothetical protein AAFQ42_06950 [Pseudomonadota bacterium]